jgi:squalene synthase HpnC
LARRHYENFTVVSWLLPRRLHRHFYHVYAYCRWADDLADETGDPQRSLELLAWWREEFARCRRGCPRHPVMVALRETIDRFSIPPELFLDLLVAFEQDQRVGAYQTYEELLAYCRYSAHPVGRLVLYLSECFDPRRAELADAICTGLQLANFWQDVAADLDRGRVYLPREDRLRFGYSDESLQGRECNAAFQQLMAFEVDRARRWFQEGLPLARNVPARLRVDIELFARGGLAILDRIAAVDFDVWRRRPTVSRRAQLRLLAGCAARAAFTRASDGAKSGWELPISQSEWVDATSRAKTGEGPEQRPPDLRDSYALCSGIARRGARNFYPAFLLLPARQRRAMCALYAFLRLTDNIGDSPAALSDRRRRLESWRESFLRSLEGRYDHPVLPALHDTVLQFEIPPRHLAAVLDGVEMDLDGARYETFDDLYAYCYRVASAVGLACLHIWGYRADAGEDGGAWRASRAEQYAEHCGIAFQLTNILRDVKEDALMGRTYLPGEDLARFGCTPETLRMGRLDEGVRGLLRFEAARAHEYYDRGAPLASLLAPPGRRAFRALFRVYRGLLGEIERRDYDVFTRRVRLRPLKKLEAVAGALLRPAQGLGVDSLIA